MFWQFFVLEFLGVLVQMVAWGLKIECKKFEEMFTKIDICLQKMVKWFLSYFCLCQSRGGEAQADVATGWSAAAAEVCWIQQASYSKN